MTYKIKIEYQTGDSYSSSDETDTLEVEWNNLEVATEALKRIEAHWKWYEGRNRNYHQKLPSEPDWHKGLDEWVIKLPLDNGNEVQMGAFWCGYFEKLYGAEIVVDLPKFRV